MTTVELRFLGGLSIHQGGRLLTTLKSQKGQALLCYLALTGKAHGRPALAGLLWPEVPEDNALMSLRTVLKKLNQHLAHQLLISRQSIAFNQNASSWIDVAEFEAGLAARSNIGRLQAAVALYQGDFLEGFYLDDAPQFEGWVLGQRARLRQAAVGGLHHLVTHFADLGDYETAITYTRQLLAIEPWQEEAHRELMHLLALSGRRSAALAQYETCRRLLAIELGVEPAAATVQPVEQIKAGALGTSAARQGEKGETLPSHNLPPQMTPFVGREAELARLGQLLAEPGVHLITILGPGGMGKTRLALALAERQVSSHRGLSRSHPYQHGVYFASLARIETADLLLPAIAETVNFSFAGGGNQREQLLRYLANKAMLLVLDNFEHLLAGTELVDEILYAAPQVKIVVTSRTRLNRLAEQLFPIEGMAYPLVGRDGGRDTPVDLSRYSAVQLFVQCARRIWPDFELSAANQLHVLQICRLLLGMPLGIVLAATWLEYLSVEAVSREIQQDLDFLATDMGDVPERQRSLRTTFNHSWRLLGEREQLIFGQLSIFRGGFTREAAEAVTGATLSDLKGLVNKSLLMLKPDGRYDVHELLRQFAAEKLKQAEELEVADSTGPAQNVHERHSVYYCTLLQKHDAHLYDDRQLEALAEVTREAANIQLAWRWALQQEAWLRLYEAIDSWSRYHQLRGLRADGEAVCQAICAGLEHWARSSPADSVTGYRLWAKAMAWYGEFAASIPTAAQRFQQSLTLLAHPELAGEDTRMIEASTLLWFGARLRGFDRKKARSCLERSLLLYKEMQDPWGIGTVLYWLSRLDWGKGEYALAQQGAEASLAIHQKGGDLVQQAASLSLLGFVSQHQGNLAEAEQFRHEALELCRLVGKRSQLAIEMANLAITLAFWGRFDQSRGWGQKSLHLCLEDGNVAQEGFARLAIGISQMHSGRYEQAQQELTRSLALVRTENNPYIEISVHCFLGYTAMVGLDYDAAQAACEEGYRLNQAIEVDSYTFLPLSGLGISTCCRSELDQSRGYFTQLLTEGLRRRDFLYLLFALPGLALYLVRRGQVERAAAVWAQAQRHPLVANSRWYADVVGVKLVTATAGLPNGVAQLARRCGQEGVLRDMAEGLLAELEVAKAGER